MDIKAQVVILPSISSEIYREDDNTLHQDEVLKSYGGVDHFHLYIISDDEIKEGDWLYHKEHGIVKNKNNFDNLNKYSYKKVIATTDTSLGKNVNFIDSKDNKANQRFENLPQPSKQFIEKYIEEYNRGNLIKDVLVECKSIRWDYKRFDPYSPNNELWVKGVSYNSIEHLPKKDIRQTYQIKISKDNTITIKEVKENWSIEEILELCENAYDSGRYAIINKDLDQTFDRWVAENLNK